MPIDIRVAACRRAGAIAWALAWAGATAVQPALAQSRGELLYTTHCIACHSTQVHWRDKTLATDWPSLEAQVRRWQSVSSLGWSQEDVREVAEHLNNAYYGFAPAKGPARVVSVSGTAP